MTTFLVMLLVGIAQQSAVPPPVAQIQANCMAPVYASDQLICSDPELADRERQIADLYHRSDLSTSVWLEPQTDWFKRRALCAFQDRHRACISEANAERLTVLAAATAQPSDDAKTMRCTSPRARQDLTIVRRGNWLIAYDGDRLSWVAGRSGTIWSPYVRWTQRRSWTVQKLDGERLECRLTT